MKKGNLIVLTALLITVLVACATPGLVKLSGVVKNVEYGYDNTYIYYILDNVSFDEGSKSCNGGEYIYVPADSMSESVRLGETVHAQCYCNDNSVIPTNSCTLIQDEK